MENTSQFADITSEDNITYTNVDGNCVSDHFYDIFSFSNCLFCFYVVLAFSMSFGVGYFMVEKLRYVYRTINKLQLLALVPLVSPVIVFLVLHILSVYVKLVHVIIADSLSFGFLSGILVTLSTSPSGKYVMKLIVRRLPTKGEVSQQNDVWLESESIKVGELRSMIATAMGITPPERVLIESGKGRILDDINVDFFKIMRDSMFMMTDFFGYRTCSCYVTVISKDELPEDGTSTALVDGVPIHKKKSGTFLSMLNTKGEAKFGVELILYAKVAAAAANVIPFYVQPSETFASAATTNPKHTMRLIKWTGAASGDNLETNGSVNLISPSANGNAIVRPGTDTDTTGDGVNINLKASGKPIHNGDVVVIECEGKYMSVTKGWWLRWNSPIARRSGAFVIEVVERAPQNKLNEQLMGGFKTVKNTFDKVLAPLAPISPSGNTASNPSPNPHQSASPSSSGIAMTGTNEPAAGNDNDRFVLRSGDAFRLRSLKFPEYEMGITNVKTRDDCSYMGLRKIGDTTSAGSDTWCQEMHYYIKFNSVATDIFKMN